MSSENIGSLGRFYTAEKFYSWQIDDSYVSAEIYCKHLYALYQPRSVVDFGCGRGAWLKALHEQGIETLVGVDGPWNSQDAMIDPAITFRSADLNDPGPTVAGETFDLAMSLEVFEHLEEQNAAKIVGVFASMAPVLMFGAALRHQGGENHINEQLQSYWAKMLISHGFEVFDYFRPTLWGDNRVGYYYRQNTYLYVKEGHDLGQALRAKGYRPIVNLDFMDCVHPDLLEYWVHQTIEQRLRKNLSGVTPEPVKQVARAVRDVVRGRG